MTTLTSAIKTVLNGLYVHLDEPPYESHIFNEHMEDSDVLFIHNNQEEKCIVVTAIDSSSVEMEFYFVDHWAEICLVAIESILSDTFLVDNNVDTALEVFIAKAATMDVSEWLDTAAMLVFSDNRLCYTPDVADGKTIELAIDPDTVDLEEIQLFVHDIIEQHL